jgi:1-hydroxycarotenoid 3,4-desaturase
MAARVVVIGAGAGGLSAALSLASRGIEVRVLERAAAPGGKMRRIDLGGAHVDGGPTVFTMRWVFDELFAQAGASLDDHVRLGAAKILARHVWPSHGPEAFDLHADVAQTKDAIGRLAGAREARGYQRFVDHTRRIFEAVDEPFLRSPKPSLRSALGLATRAGLSIFARIDAHRTMHDALSDFFRDPRLLQLFGRYATYAGSSPFAAPATLNVIAHVEQRGVFRVEGGMFALAEGLARRAAELGAIFTYDADVVEVAVSRGRVRGVCLASGEIVPADAVIFNGDPGALASGALGTGVRRATTVRGEPSLSAITVAFLATPSGLAPELHNVVFSRDDRHEMDQLFSRRRVPEDATVYLFAPDRGDARVTPPARERFFALINAPSTEAHRPHGDADAWKTKVLTTLARAGLRLSNVSTPVVTTPSDFARMFPGSGGAIYGAASHRMTAAFARAGATTKVRGLFLAGGAVHPGAGVPMAARSGMIAASAVIEDLAATRTSWPVATSGFTSTS